jgi:rhodanese-related sulfurtransferase
MKRSFVEALGIILFAAVVAFGAHFARSDSLPFIREKPGQDTNADGEKSDGSVLTIEQFLEAIKQGGVVILDARPKEDFDEAHIPGARSLPEEVCVEQFSQVLAGFPLQQEIVVYCTGIECGSAEEVAALLVDAGYANTRVYAAGWEEWEALELPVESSYAMSGDGAH